MKCVLSSMEAAVFTFIQKIADRPSAWKKEELIAEWNQLSSEEKSDREPSKKEKPQTKPSATEREQCTFKITRGDKIGERCTSRAKEHSSFCVKHTKGERKEEKEEDKVEPKEKKPEHHNSSVRMEQKFKEKERETPRLETEVVDGHTVAKGTNVVIQDKFVVGYLDGTSLVLKANADTEKVVRTYQLVWKHDTIDE